MELLFLGTRGYIKPRTLIHRMHSSLMVVSGGKRIMFDCGEDWLDIFRDLAPDAICITHAHPDHAGGLKKGAKCPVYATAESWERMKRYPIPERIPIVPRVPVSRDGLTIEAFGIDHSFRAPAVGYRIGDRSAAVFYVPDVVSIHERSEALAGIDLYIGDGATVVRSMVRNREGTLFGHTPVRTQLTWCQEEGVVRAIFTHCGSEIVNGEPAMMTGRVRKLGDERGVEARIARDGLEIAFPL